MRHIAALAHGGNVMILPRMAEHIDLDVFLRHVFKPRRDILEARKAIRLQHQVPRIER